MAAQSGLTSRSVTRTAAKAAGARWDAAERRWYAPQPGMPGLARWAPLPGPAARRGPRVRPGPVRRPDPADVVVRQRPVARSIRGTGTGCAAWCTAGPGTAARPAAPRQAGTVAYVLDAHERFTYDIPSGIQRLVRLVCLCHWCHTATHIGMACVRGVRDEAIAHLMTVTGMSPAQAGEHIDEAFARWERRSSVSWQVDLSLITAAGIRLAEAAQAPGDYGQPGPGERSPAILVMTAMSVPASLRAATAIRAGAGPGGACARGDIRALRGRAGRDRGSPRPSAPRLTGARGTTANACPV